MKLLRVLALLVLATATTGARADGPSDFSLVGLYGFHEGNSASYVGTLTFDGEGAVTGTRKAFR